MAFKNTHIRYKYIYLPVETPIEDGCFLMDSEGIPFKYDVNTHWNLDLPKFKVCEPFLVSFEYNHMQIIGQVSPLVTWLQPNDWVKIVDCFEKYCDPTLPPGIIKFYDGPLSGGLAVSPVWRIKCPTCGDLH